MATIFHIALASEWASAQTSGSYTTSTLGRSLADEGFIHASRGDQWPAVRERFYADAAEPLVLLQIDTDLLGVPVVDEVVDTSSGETFPHIYGPLAVTAVVKALRLGASTPAAEAPQTEATLPPVPAQRRTGTQADFSKAFFTEMFFNLGVLIVPLVCSLAGLVVGRELDDEWGPGIGGIVGLILGAVIAVRLYRRRHAAGKPV